LIWQQKVYRRIKIQNHRVDFIVVALFSQESVYYLTDVVVDGLGNIILTLVIQLNGLANCER
jgi:hypothetical protein